MKARIYKPSKSAMQSGSAHSSVWRLEYEMHEPREVEPLMGWTSLSDTSQQISLNFKSLDSAINFAKKENLEYYISNTNEKNYLLKSYADNFINNKKN
ncbi:ETC complex I subunit [Alphaproteobacteria bacterium]|nr:ETC complex I subunit [Alphaproteobacteria bacterium]|tara:strand:+ start:70 stop:363 length:294 start_codon:yes stop_codon:yes gene_type:complete